MSLRLLRPLRHLPVVDGETATEEDPLTDAGVADGEVTTEEDALLDAGVWDGVEVGVPAWERMEGFWELEGDVESESLPPKATAGPGVVNVPKLDQMSGNFTLS